jgi:hypothetical protein
VAGEQLYGDTSAADPAAALRELLGLRLVGGSR